MSGVVKLAAKYKLGKKIGSGSFGQIYIGISCDTGAEVAVKLEPIKTKCPQLLHESRIMKIFSGQPGMPEIHWFGTEGDYNVMVMQLLGPNLEDLFRLCGMRFSLKTALMVADQMISRLEYIHSKGFIHRDMKPDNFLVGLGEKSHLIHIIDFGLARRYRDDKTNAHIPFKADKSLIGTARFASVSTHMGIEQSRRDELEGILYIVLYFLRGSLPWQALAAKTKAEKYQKIREMKIATSLETLCEGFPIEFELLLKYCKDLKFEEDPDYSFIKGQLKSIFEQNSYTYDLLFDWSYRVSGYCPKMKAFEAIEEHASTKQQQDTLAANLLKCLQDEKKEEGKIASVSDRSAAQGDYDPKHTKSEDKIWESQKAHLVKEDNNDPGCCVVV